MSEYDTEIYDDEEIEEFDSPLEDDPAEDVYFKRSREPLTALIFIAPMLVCYELGVLFFGHHQIQNGIDACLRSTLSSLGFGQYFLLPLLAIFLLLGWHYTLHRPWRPPRARLFGAMATECLLLALVPWLLWNVMLIAVPPEIDNNATPDRSVATSCDRSYDLGYDPMTDTFRHANASVPVAQSSKPSSEPSSESVETVASYDMQGPVSSINGGDDSLLSRVGRAVGFFGAGVYEELFFRLILLSLILWAMLSLGVSRVNAVIGAVLLSSLLFSAAHYIGPVGDTLDLTTFTFRVMTGAFFAMLFIHRGFGIAAGSHAAYNILVGTILR